MSEDATMSHDRANWLRVAKERDEIQAERDQLRASVQTWEAAANAHLARAEQSEAKLHALRIVCGTDDANKFTTWCDRAVARAEKAEARIAELETANRELLHTLKVIAGMWIADTTPLAPPDALAERMGKLALAATLRKHP